MWETMLIIAANGLAETPGQSGPATVLSDGASVQAGTSRDELGLHGDTGPLPPVHKSQGDDASSSEPHWFDPSIPFAGQERTGVVVGGRRREGRMKSEEWVGNQSINRNKWSGCNIPATRMALQALTAHAAVQLPTCRLADPMNVESCRQGSLSVGKTED